MIATAQSVADFGRVPGAWLDGFEAAGVGLRHHIEGLAGFHKTQSLSGHALDILVRRRDADLGIHVVDSITPLFTLLKQ